MSQSEPKKRAMAASGWTINASDTARRANNPIRKIVDNIKKPDLQGKPLIPLSLGDPTIFGNFSAPEVLVNAVEANLRSGRHNGYIHSAGSIEARKSIAQRYTLPESPLTENDVVIASGCSGALDLAITVLCNPGEVLLVPRPAFPLYATLCESKGVKTHQYALLPSKGWEVDLQHLEACLAGTDDAEGSSDSSDCDVGEPTDDATAAPPSAAAAAAGARSKSAPSRPRIAALLVNNPSNPCGSVYSKEHLSAILALADKYRVPVIADEIYGNLVFPSAGVAFHPMAGLTDSVPILSCGGIAKEFLVPGWRVGWVTIHDRNDLFSEVRKGLFALSQLILGANSLIISALPAILTPVPGSEAETSLHKFRHDTINQLETNALYCAKRLQGIPGIEVIFPQGAMYLMFGVSCGSVFTAPPPAGAANGADPVIDADHTPSPSPSASASSAVEQQTQQQQHYRYDPAIFGSDLTFAQALLSEENVFVLPGAAFSLPGYCRIVFCAPIDRLRDAMDRMEAFCARHRVPVSAADREAIAAAAANATGAGGSSFGLQSRLITNNEHARDDSGMFVGGASGIGVILPSSNAAVPPSLPSTGSSSASSSAASSSMVRKGPASVASSSSSVNTRASGTTSASGSSDPTVYSAIHGSHNHGQAAPGASSSSASKGKAFTYDNDRNGSAAGDDDAELLAAMSITGPGQTPPQYMFAGPSAAAASSTVVGGHDAIRAAAAMVLEQEAQQ